MTIVIKEIRVKTTIEREQSRIFIPDEVVQDLKRSIIRDIQGTSLLSTKKRRER